ncbi:MAG: hypothetical protein ABW079_06670 [Sedimenticola sp.]
MKQILNAEIIGAKRYDIDGNKMAAMFIIQEAAPTDDVVGLEVMKISAPYGVVDQLKKHTLPGDFEIEADMKSASGGKIGLVATGIRPRNGSKPPAKS